ncbi:cellulose biosynthesis protein BcsF [Zobellella aerophila]|uniref:Cellulose biosynthesis protein BcsF n=1 Tax=Zobellella aerophila TaxID=870480 RepID=A0ABP6WCN1_9GAMM
MRISDIVGVFLLCAAVMLPLGYCLCGWLPRFRQWLRALLLSPRYLKSEGIRQRKTSTPTEPEHDPKH